MNSMINAMMKAMNATSLMQKPLPLVSGVPIIFWAVFTTLCIALGRCWSNSHTRLWCRWLGSSQLHRGSSELLRKGGSLSNIRRKKRWLRAFFISLEVLVNQNKSSEIWIPRNLKLVTCSTIILLMLIGVWVLPLFFQKSTVSSLVLVGLRSKLLSVSSL